jgi:tetratricopeptide (TPR) repeat protein
MWVPGSDQGVPQQLLMKGLAFGQQAMLAEHAGNAWGAAQCYDQAVALIEQSMWQARSWSQWIPDDVFATQAQAHAGAARVKQALGQGPAVWLHLQQALGALNQAIALNPGVAAYHAGAGALLLTMGQVAEAQRAFATAAHLGGGNPMLQSALGQLQAKPQAPVPMPMPFAAGAAMPGGMPFGGGAGPGAPFGSATGGGAAAGAAPDWGRRVKEVCGVLDAVFGTLNTGMKTWGTAQDTFGWN